MGFVQFRYRSLAREAPPLGEIPFEAFPSLTASTRHQGYPCSPSFVPPRCWRCSSSPLRVATQRRVWRRASTSRPCSVRESVANVRCCHRTPPDAPMGLLSGIGWSSWAPCHGPKAAAAHRLCPKARSAAQQAARPWSEVPFQSIAGYAAESPGFGCFSEDWHPLPGWMLPSGFDPLGPKPSWVAVAHRR